MIHGEMPCLAEKKDRCGEVLDFSVNINPYGIHPTIVRAGEITHCSLSDIRHQIEGRHCEKGEGFSHRKFSCQWERGNAYHCTGDGKTGACPLPVLFWKRQLLTVGSKVSLL